MQNLKFVALPVPEIIIQYIGILSLRYPHTSGLLCDAGISRNHVADPPMVIYNNRRARGKSQRHTDGWTTCDRNTVLCTKVHRAVKTRKFVNHKVTLKTEACP